MDKFLKWLNLSNFMQEETGNVNWPVFTREIEFITKNLLTKKTPGPDNFTGELQ